MRNNCIVSVTCDMGGKDSKVWKELCVNTKKNVLCESCLKMWVNYDIPHLLKLFRNSFIDDIVTLPNGTVLRRKVSKNS
ncbi:hypothetical protein PR048_019373 [Dryococelus australis]|uniref:Uncharacterized protein n=1 Tax=Dryococelus australis TaxID=614101 RepID=A0ABQ9H3G2_9NEOP|nr:hypothetical protein PR048_019373 [Dryococelus australis]